MTLKPDVGGWEAGKNLVMRGNDGMAVQVNCKKATDSLECTMTNIVLPPEVGYDRCWK